MHRLALITLASLAWATPCTAVPRFRPPARPSIASLLAGQPILPNGTLIHDGERLRSLELDELAPLRLRWTTRF